MFKSRCGTNTPGLSLAMFQSMHLRALQCGPRWLQSCLVRLQACLKVRLTLMSPCMNAHTGLFYEEMCPI